MCAAVAKCDPQRHAEHTAVGQHKGVRLGGDGDAPKASWQQQGEG
jgi:hypothetical protein